MVIGLRRVAAASLAAATSTVAVLAFGATTTAAAARLAAGNSPPAKTAVIRAAHFSPNTPGVDVYLTSYSGATAALWLSDVGYGDVSKYRTIKPGLYFVSMRKHGAAASSPAALKWTLNAKPRRAYTAAAVGMNAHLKGIVLSDRLGSPSNGHGLVRVIQAASRAPRADVVAEPHKVVASNAVFATATHYASVPAGKWTVRAAAVPKSVSATTAVTVQPGSVNSLVVLDSKGKGIELRSIEDASGAARSPRGAVDAGGGGMAPAPQGGGHSAVTTNIALAAAGSALSALLVLAVRRRTTFGLG